MLNFSRGDRTADVLESRSPARPGLKPAIYEPPAVPVPPAGGVGMRPVALPPEPMPSRNAVAGSPTATRTDGHPAASLPAKDAAPASSPEDVAGSKLFVGVNIQLKGVEISDCDVLVVEGHVEATVHSKAMQIAKPGTLKGTALIDNAEVHGEFTGELTARTRLVVHGSGRVSGTIRYGRLIVADGGEISGDVKRLDGDA